MHSTHPDLAPLLTHTLTHILSSTAPDRDEAIDETLDKVVKLLAYVSDKDLFSEFYRKKLARRLLHNMSANDDHERSILTRLKQQCGAQVGPCALAAALF